MAKKKKISSSLLKREIDKKLYYGFILLTLLICILVAFLYSIPAIGIPIQDQIQTYLQNLLQGWTNPPPPSPSPIFVHHSRPAMVIAPTSTFVATTTTNCQSVGYTTSQAETLVDAYYSKAPNDQIETLHLIVVCGTPSMGGYATQFTLTASEGSMWSSQFSYHDAQMPGLTTKHTCKLSVASSSSYVVICGESSFTLEN